MKWPLRFVTALYIATLSLCVSKADALDLTGTWRGIQICPGTSQGVCPVLSQTVNEEGAITEFDFFIRQEGDTIKAFSSFFVQHYNGLVIDNGCCKSFSLVDCTTEPRDLENPARIAEVAVLTVFDDDHFVGTSSVTGNFLSPDPAFNFGLFTETCTWSYRRVSHEIPEGIVECCCGLAAEVCPEELSSPESCPTTTTCSSSSSSSSTSSCPKEVKKPVRHNQVKPKPVVKKQNKPKPRR